MFLKVIVCLRDFGLLTGYILLWRGKDRQRTPKYDQGAITTVIQPSSLQFSKCECNGPINNKSLFQPPGPEPFKHICLPTSHSTELCFWIKRSSLLLADPYYPEETLEYVHPYKCSVRIPIKVASNGMFLPNSGISHTLIPPHINPRMHLNVIPASRTLLYHGKSVHYPWIRTFHWKYEGIYTLSSRPYKKFEFTYYFPVLLPSRIPAAIYGLCRQSAINDASCSKDIFNISQH
ncbi:hypothetical protein DSO57_1032738 [Entomophthora muscae]|uniref:Uncharacterized protein n=1 Tax=Entomophthora muscae TaxID=34485 RepID=A0ACC2TMA9_9FUNG|nr:hypothetical protein DSO57_1032738 [Entomophthora muscae]